MQLANTLRARWEEKLKEIDKREGMAPVPFFFLQVFFGLFMYLLTAFVCGWFF